MRGGEGVYVWKERRGGEKKERGVKGGEEKNRRREGNV